MPVTDPSLLSYGETRSEIELQIMAAARRLEVEGTDKANVIHAVAQILIDLCLEDDDLPARDKIEIMRHNGRCLLTIVEEVEDRIAAIDRSRAAGLPDASRN